MADFLLRWLKFCVSLVFIVARVSATTLSFTSSVPLVEDSVTSSLTLRCGLYDTGFTTTGSTGTGSGSATLVGRDVSSATTRVTHVTSIVITRHQGDHVASLTQYVPLRQFADLDNLKVTGDVFGSGSELGYIELKWAWPGQEQTGDYLCQVVALDNLGHPHLYNTSVTVTPGNLTLDRLADAVRLLHMDNDVLKSQLSSTNPGNCSTNISTSCASSVSASELSDINRELRILQAAKNSMSADVNHLRNSVHYVTADASLNRQDLVNLRQLVNSLTSDQGSSDLLKNLNDVRADVTSLASKFSLFTDNSDDVTKQMTLLNATLAGLSSLVEDVQINQTSLAAQLEILQDVCSDHTDEISAKVLLNISGKLDNVMSNVSGIEEVLDELKGSNLTLNSVLINVTKDMITLAHKVDDVDPQLADMKSQLNNLEVENKNSSSLVHQLSVDTNKCYDYIHQVQSGVADLEKIISNLTSSPVVTISPQTTTDGQTTVTSSPCATCDVINDLKATTESLVFSNNFLKGDVANLQYESRDMRARIATLEANHQTATTAITSAPVDQNNSALLLEIDQLKTENKDLKAEMYAMKNELSRINSILTGSRHIEQGVGMCGSTIGWMGVEGNNKFTVVITQFNTPYDTDPFLNIGVVKYNQNKEQDSYFSVELVDHDRAGFKVKCTTFHDVHLWDLRFSWISMPAN